MIKFEELKDKIENLGYIATEELIYDTFNALCMFSDGEINAGQDIFAICLEGPPGAGKTEFAKTYTKLANQVFGNVEMVDYQCDATTGKTELFEDINISAAIRGDADNVNIPGKLIEAINKVNEGKKIVLFIDEYDKAREETDAFLLQFLQSGKINSTQHGDLEIKQEYKSNLQVILCKNDMREELSGPLSRRIRIIRLDYMEPATFYQVAHRCLIENKTNKINDSLLNLVSLMYQKAYDSKELYNRLPSCSEMMIAIEDADRLMKKANAPQHIIYNTIIRNMFKSLDDINTFESGLDAVKSQDESYLTALIQSMKISQPNEEIDLNSLIAQNVFKDESAKLTEKTDEMQKLIDEYKIKFKQMEEERKKTIEDEIKKINLQGGKLVSTTNIPNVIKNFEDESAYIKRGYDIFGLSSQDWVDVATVEIYDLSHHTLIENLIKYASELEIKIYENGILLREDGDIKLIAINDLNEEHKPRYRIMCNIPVIPSTYVSDIYNFINTAHTISNNQPLTMDRVVSQVGHFIEGKVLLNSLIYNDLNLNYKEIMPNVYHFDFSANLVSKSEEYELQDIDILKNISKEFKCDDINNALTSSKSIMKEKRKELVNE